MIYRINCLIYFMDKILTKILLFLTAMYTILFPRRLQPTRDFCAVRVQWLSTCSMRSSGLYNESDLSFCIGHKNS